MGRPLWKGPRGRTRECLVVVYRDEFKQSSETRRASSQSSRRAEARPAPRLQRRLVLLAPSALARPACERVLRVRPVSLSVGMPTLAAAPWGRGRWVVRKCCLLPEWELHMETARGWQLPAGPTPRQGGGALRRAREARESGPRCPRRSVLPVPSGGKAVRVPKVLQRPGQSPTPFLGPGGLAHN